jgi:TrmH family RNA methyltransferase
MRRGSARALVARFRSLSDPHVRRRLQHCVAEGTAALIATVESRIRVHQVAWCRTLLDSTRGRNLVQDLDRSGVPVARVDEPTFAALSLQPRPSGVAFILQQPWRPLAHLTTGRSAVHLAVRRVRHAGNLGTLVRTLEAVDGGGLIVLGPDVDPFGPDVLRGSMGSVLRRPVARTGDLGLRRWAEDQRLRIVGASPRAGVPYDAATAVHPLANPAVLLLGEERRGLTPADAALCSAWVHLPILGSVDSLNLGVAGSVLLYEVLRRSPERPPQSPCAGPVG